MGSTNNFDNDYHGLLAKILDEGFDKGDRTGTGTRSLFGEQLKFDILKKLNGI